jgi:hypothetical protein
MIRLTSGIVRNPRITRPLTTYKGENRLLRKPSSSQWRSWVDSCDVRPGGVIGCEASGLFRRGGTEHAVSLSDAPNGKSSRLLTAVLTVESQPALTEVVVPSVRRIDLRCRPIESVGFQSRILARPRSGRRQQRMKSRAASGHERLVCRVTQLPSSED